MDLHVEHYCDKPIKCSCGQTHYCPIKKVVIENGAIVKLPALMAGYERIFVVADDNTYGACGAAVCAALQDKLCGKLVFHREGVLVPDERAVEELMNDMPSDCDFIVGIGSGVINDICKYVTFQKGMDYAIVATAPSMDGYASSGAAMITGGMKVTYTTHPPRMIIADVSVIQAAPMEMIKAGYGDIIGKYSSLCDWKLSKVVNNEHFCPEIYNLVLNLTHETRARAEKIAQRDAEAIAFLMNALVLSGVALSLVGSTRPGSGSEHHLSHFFEIVGLLRNEPYFVHGTDVAYSTVVTAQMRERIIRECADKPCFAPEAKADREKAWRRIYTTLYDEIAALQAESGSYERDLRPIYVEKWPEIIQVLSECPSAAELVEMFERVGLDMAAFEGLYGSEKIADARYYGKDLKNRYSVLWLYYVLFSGKR